MSDKLFTPYDSTKPPRDIGIERELMSTYDMLKSGQGEFVHSPFRGLQNYDIFLTAMAVGAARGVQKPLKNRQGSIPRRMFQSGGGEALVMSLAAAEKGTLEVLSDQKLVYSLAEAFANAGIHILIDQVKNATGTMFMELEDNWRTYILDVLTFKDRFLTKTDEPDD